MDIIIRHPAIFRPLDDPYRYKVMYGGRGSAKSWTVARKLLLLAIEQPIRILCTRELQKSIKQSVHKLLDIQIDLLGLRNLYEVTGNVIRSHIGSEFIFLGVKHNTEEIKSTEAIDICWIEEGHNLTEASFDIIDPTIRKENSEIWMTYNTRFKFDHLHQTFVVNNPPPGSLVMKVNHDDNPYFPDVLKKQMDHMKETDYEKYLHIWEGELKRLAEGAIFGGQITEVHKSGRETYISIQKNCEILTFWDVGKSDHTAVWFVQKVGTEYHFIDFFMGRLEEVEYYTKFLRSRDYLYGVHYMPHDADHDRLGMKRNIKQQFQDGGIKPITIVDRIAHKETAVSLARDIFPQCWFHKGNDNDPPDWHGDDKSMKSRASRMEKGMEALSNYRYKYKEDDDVYTLNPHHDWASNPADAFMQFAQCDITSSDGTYADWAVAVNG